MAFWMSSSVYLAIPVVWPRRPPRNQPVNRGGDAVGVVLKEERVTRMWGKTRCGDVTVTRGVGYYIPRLTQSGNVPNFSAPISPLGGMKQSSSGWKNARNHANTPDNHFGQVFPLSNDNTHNSHSV